MQRRSVAPAVSLITHVRAGFLDEPDELAGISHVLEHMLFKGTPSLAPGELAQRVKAIGGSLNAYTAYDHTVYLATAPAANVAELATLQADQVRNPTLDPGELARELGVIIQEAKRKLDSPSAVSGETLHELLFREHRLRRWRIGHAEQLERFTRDDVAGYHASRYVPARTIVALVGDVDQDRALEMLRERWSDWRGANGDIPDPPRETSEPAMRARRMSGDVSLVELAIGWRGVGALHPDARALDLAAAVLSVGRGSRLSRMLREPGIANGVGASHYSVPDVGVFTIAAEANPERLESTARTIAGVLADLLHEPPARDELDCARTMMLMRLARRLERYESRATALAEEEALGDVTRIDREASEYLAVTPEQVQAVMREHLIPDVACAIAYCPESSAVQFDVDMFADAMTAGALRPPAITLAPIELTSRDVRPATLTARRSPPTAPRVTHLALSNLDILAVQHGDVPQVAMHVYRHRVAIEDAFTAGLTSLAMRVIPKGTVRRSAAELALAAESLGGVIASTLGADVVGLSLTVAAEHARAGASLLAEVLHEPRIDPDVVAVERRLQIEDARAIADDMVSFPIQLMLGVAFNDRHYGAPALGTPESVAQFDASRVRAWHEQWLATGRTTVIVVGADEAERLAEDVAREFDSRPEARESALSLSKGLRPEASPPLAYAEGAAARLASGPSTSSGQALGPLAFSPGTRTATRQRQQSALAMLFPGPARTDPDRFAAEVWSAIAAGLGGRLFESLRSARSLAYTVVANSWQRRHAGGLLTYIAMAPERLNEARDAMLDELRVFHDQPPTREELLRATAMLAGQAEIARQTASAVAGEIASAWLVGEGLSELDDPGARYRAVTAQDVHRVAAASLDPASRAEGVVEASAAQ